MGCFWPHELAKCVIDLGGTLTIVVTVAVKCANPPKPIPASALAMSFIKNQQVFFTVYIPRLSGEKYAANHIKHSARHRKMQ